MKHLKTTSILAFILALSVILSSCGVSTPSSASNEVNSSTTQTSSDTNLTEAKTLKIVDWFDSSKERKKEFNQQFMDSHPGVTIEYTCLTIDQFKNTIMTSLKSGDGPDLFPLPDGIRLEMAVKDNWYANYSDYVPQSVIDTVKKECIVEGYQKLDGILYALPEDYAVPSPFVFYNKDIFAAAGLDPNSPPKTWNEFRDVCKKITEVGNGKFYGIIEGGNQKGRWEIIARGWASVAGGYSGRTNTAMLQNGRPIFETQAMLDTLNLFKNIFDDGSYHPDTMNFSAPEARALFADGQAGFLVQGIWCVATWSKSHPNLNYGVMPIPLQDGQLKGYVAKDAMGMGLGIYAKSKAPHLAGNYLAELYSEKYQGTLVSDGGFVSIVEGVNEKYMQDGVGKDYYNIFSEQTKTIPDPRVIEPGVSDFYLNVKDVQPGLSDIFQGVLVGSIKDTKGALIELSDKSFDKWTSAATEAGIDISTFEFKNWNPLQDYSQDMYENK